LFVIVQLSAIEKNNMQLVHHVFELGAYWTDPNGVTVG